MGERPQVQNAGVAASDKGLLPSEYATMHVGLVNNLRVVTNEYGRNEPHFRDVKQYGRRCLSLSSCDGVGG